MLTYLNKYKRFSLFEVVDSVEDMSDYRYVVDLPEETVQAYKAAASEFYRTQDKMFDMLYDMGVLEEFDDPQA